MGKTCFVGRRRQFREKNGGTEVKGGMQAFLHTLAQVLQFSCYNKHPEACIKYGDDGFCLLYHGHGVLFPHLLYQFLLLVEYSMVDPKLSLLPSGSFPINLDLES